MLKLFYAPGACSLASHIALEEAGAQYEGVRVDLKNGEQFTPEYLRVNPKSRVPALQTEEGVLTENPAILAYIGQRFPAAGLIPLDNPFAFADLQAFNVYLTSTVHISFAHAFRPGRYADGDAAAAAMREKVPPTLDQCFALIEGRFADGRPYVNGERFTVSDGYLFVFERWLRDRGYGHPELCPRVMAHCARVAARPAVARVLAAEGFTS